MTRQLRVQTAELAENQAALCAIFANPKRVLILWALAEEEKAVTAIAQAIDASLQSTSQHLSLMKEAGIVAARRDGQTIYFHISAEARDKRCRLLLEVGKRHNDEITAVS